jgi:hypothetical protein
VMTDPCGDSCDTEGYQYCGASKVKNGTYACLCIDGFSQIREGSGCKDINECESLETNNCDVNGRCVNIPGDYFCVCNSGYEGYGREGGCTATPAPTPAPTAPPTVGPVEAVVATTPAPVPPAPAPSCFGNNALCSSGGQCCSGFCV